MGSTCGIKKGMAMFKTSLFNDNNVKNCVFNIYVNRDGEHVRVMKDSGEEAFKDYTKEKRDDDLGGYRVRVKRKNIWLIYHDKLRKK